MASVSYIHPHDPNRSTILEELDAMDWQFSQLARLLTEIEGASDAHGRGFSVREVWDENKVSSVQIKSHPWE